MIVPIYLILRYSEGFKVYLRENVSDPEDYDLDWLKKTMLILSSMYIFYLVLLFKGDKTKCDKLSYSA